MKNCISARLLWVIGLALVLFTFVSHVHAQPATQMSATIDGHSFLTVPLKPGSPDFPPVKRRLATDAQFGTVQLGDTLGTLFICCGKDTAGQWLFYRLHHGPDQMWHLTVLDFGQNVGDTLHTTFDLTMHNGRETPFPLDLRLALSKGKMFVRWLLSPEYPGLPGGIPTPADIALDKGKHIFPFTITSLTGEPIHSKDLAGKVTVINWWSTWCTGCKLEIDGFNGLVKEYQSRVNFLAVAFNSQEELKAFLAEQPFDFRQAVTTDSMSRYTGSGFPRTVVLNVEGIVTYDKIGGGPDSYLDVKKGIEAAFAGK